MCAGVEGGGEGGRGGGVASLGIGRLQLSTTLFEGFVLYALLGGVGVSATPPIVVKIMV